MSIFDFIPTFQESPFTYILLPIILISSCIGFYSKPYYQALLIHPYELCRGKRLHTLLSSAFVHRNWKHLVTNMVFLYILSYDLYGNLQQVYPNKSPLLLSIVISFLLITLSNLIQSIHKRNDFMFTSVGASGLSFGLVGFCGLFFPTDSLSRLMLPFIGNSFYSCIALLILLYIFTRLKRNTSTNVFLHLYAFVIGVTMALVARPEALKEIIGLF